MELTDKNEEKGSYLFHWNVRADEAWKAINATKTKIQTSLMKNSPWKYRHKLSEHDNWAKKLLGIAVMDSGYECALSRNITVSNKELSKLISSSWLDDKTNELIMSGILLIPHKQMIIIIHDVFKRIHESDKEILIVNGNLSSWYTWLCRAVLSMICIKWLFTPVESFQNSRKTSLVFLIIIIIMFIAEFMLEVAVEEATSALQNDINVDHFEAVFYEWLLENIQAVVTFFMAFRITQLLMFKESLQQIMHRLRTAVKTFISIWLLQIFMILIISHSIYISQCDEEQEFKSIFTAFIMLTVYPGRCLKHSSILQFPKCSSFWITTILLFMKYTFYALFFAEFRCQISMNNHNKEVKEITKIRNKNQSQIQNKVSVCSEATKRLQIDNSRLNNERKDKTSSEMINSTELMDGYLKKLPTIGIETAEHWLNLRLFKVLICLNENYLDMTAWDIFLFDLSFHFKKLKDDGGNIVATSRNKSKKKTILNFPKEKIQHHQTWFDKKNGIDGKLKLPKIKIKKDK